MRKDQTEIQINTIINSYLSPLTRKQVEGMPLKVLISLCLKLHEELLETKKNPKVQYVYMHGSAEDLLSANTRIAELEEQLATLIDEIENLRGKV